MAFLVAISPKLNTSVGFNFQDSCSFTNGCGSCTTSFPLNFQDKIKFAIPWELIVQLTWILCSCSNIRCTLRPWFSLENVMKLFHWMKKWVYSFVYYVWVWGFWSTSFLLIILLQQLRLLVNRNSIKLFDYWFVRFVSLPLLPQTMKGKWTRHHGSGKRSSASKITATLFIRREFHFRSSTTSSLSYFVPHPQPSRLQTI